jgi:hypothetical protein
MTLSDFFRGDYDKESEPTVLDVAAPFMNASNGSYPPPYMQTLAPSNHVATRALNFDAPSQAYTSDISELRSRIEDLENRLIAIEVSISSTVDARAAFTDRIRQIEDRLYDMERQQ